MNFPSALLSAKATLPRLAAHAGGLFVARGDSTAPQLVTSAHAMRALLPFIDDLAALGNCWRAYAAGLNTTALAVTAAPRPQTWPRIMAVAVQNQDAHLIELVDSCRDQEQALGGKVWRVAASRALR